MSTASEDMGEKMASLIDNVGDNTLLNVLSQLLPETKKLDIATGTFEVGSLLALGDAWRALEEIRLVMGDETTKRSRQVLVESLKEQTECSIESFKARDDNLTGLPAVRQALQDKIIKARVYHRTKFHAKCYLAQTKPPQPNNVGLVGSSNFTVPGLSTNIELNLSTTDQLHFQALQKWFNGIWGKADDVNGDLLRVIERHLRTFEPFEVWAKALYEYRVDKEVPEGEWEKDSVVLPLLSKYQEVGYRQARRIAEKWGGALICDGVGLGKTYIGAMLLEYHLKKGHRILLIVPKSVRPVWESKREDDPVRLIQTKYRLAFRNLVEIRNETYLGQEGTASEDELAYYRDFTQVIIVDEAHHFRTPNANRSRVLRRLCEGPQIENLYFLTATPINNSLRDLYNLINYISRDRLDHFRSLGIQNVSSHFTKAEKQLAETKPSGYGSVDVQTAAHKADVLRTDKLLKELVIQRSRAYVMESEKNSAVVPVFPKREKPRVISYSLKKVYAGLYHDLNEALIKNEKDKDKRYLRFAIYNPEPFRKVKEDSLLNRDKQILGLIRTLLLKRLESSYKAFEASLENLLLKMAAFVNDHDAERFEMWCHCHTAAWTTVQQRRKEGQSEEDPNVDLEEGNEFDDIKRPELDGEPDEYELDGLLEAILKDMSLLMELLEKVDKHLSPETDDKLQKLVHHLQRDPLLKDNKVVIFTEFKDTARYLCQQLHDEHGFADVEELDSTRNVDRGEVIKRFAPYYNCSDDELPEYVDQQTRILISTDVLAEGLNLQDANLIVNYDVHWNPVRLMQRIGRVDRRLNLKIERQLGRDGNQPLKVHVFNFLPPEELEDLLGLLEKVSDKLLHISKTLGIEAPVLKPNDPFAALKLFNERYDGKHSVDERLQLELERLHREHPTLYEKLSGFPKRVFTGKRTSAGGTRGLFCCYRFPPMKNGGTVEDTISTEIKRGLPVTAEQAKELAARLNERLQEQRASEDRGEVRWYFRVADTGEIWESGQLGDIANAIRSKRETKRVTQASGSELKKWREEIERKHVEPYLRDLQTLRGTKATLVCWMEVC